MESNKSIHIAGTLSDLEISKVSLLAFSLISSAIFLLSYQSILSLEFYLCFRNNHTSSILNYIISVISLPPNIFKRWRCHVVFRSRVCLNKLVFGRAGEYCFLILGNIIISFFCKYIRRIRQTLLQIRICN